MHAFVVVAQLGRKVNTLADVKSLELSTYITAVVFALGFLAVAAILSSAIAYEGGANPRDPRKRKLVFWSLAVTALVTFFSYERMFAAPLVAIRWQARFMSTTAYSAIVVIAVYLLIGFLISKVFANGKLGTWFGRGSRGRA
jgi:sulfoxide reductase heme-binding subunit YedZ